jgi:uncharacterized surface anchored protein
MRGKFRVAITFCLLAVFSIGALRAQVTSTTIYGTVTDATGATVAGAKVSATNTDTNLSRTAQTNAEGEYRIELLPVGNYKIEIAAAGFERFVRSGIALEVNVPARVDALLQLGDVNQTVTVTGAISLINTSSPEIGRTIENEEIANMPLVNRNAYELLELTPGVEQQF